MDIFEFQRIQDVMIIFYLAVKITRKQREIFSIPVLFIMFNGPLKLKRKYVLMS